MKKSQLNAISYSYQKKKNEQEARFIIRHDGTLERFKASRYKYFCWYIRANYREEF